MDNIQVWLFSSWVSHFPVFPSSWAGVWKYIWLFAKIKKMKRNFGLKKPSVWISLPKQVNWSKHFVLSKLVEVVILKELGPIHLLLKLVPKVHCYSEKQNMWHLFSNRVANREGTCVGRHSCYDSSLIYDKTSAIKTNGYYLGMSPCHFEKKKTASFMFQLAKRNLLLSNSLKGFCVCQVKKES